jgi:(1->4)-alpha-D-glucan 1-alpha-D-glucosylmutase
VQLNKEFNFDSLRSVLPYLSKLGISHIYASPIFASRPGSSHGYDILDSNRINEELGGPVKLYSLLKEVHALGLEWIQDIVPNHIAYSPESAMISDVMKMGTDSFYHNFLDVDWNSSYQHLKGRILAPFLKESFEKAILQGKISLIYHNGFQIKYNNLEFPIKISSYKKILPESDYATLSDFCETYNSDKKLRLKIEGILKTYNQNTGLLRSLLSKQIFALAEWRSVFREINYRRFFDISDLICLRMEEKDVFETTHKLISRLLFDYHLSGLRIDHIDGLYNPEEYLIKLRRQTPNAYVIVEKILQCEEILPKSWPVQGTTGYDFLNKLNGLFIEKKNEKEITSNFKKFTGTKASFNNLLNQSKKLVIRKNFGGDVENLSRSYYEIIKNKPYGKNCTFRSIRKAVIELLSAFSIYRTYISNNSNTGQEYFISSLHDAKIRNEDLKEELSAMEMLLEESASFPDSLYLIMRLQQYTGSIMAKGLEDTLFYIYNRLLSLNEVGSDPTKFGLSKKDFCDFLISRQCNWPMSLNATSTHDTKRGEDSRARINVLSEISSQFYAQVEKWSKLNLKSKKALKNRQVPSKNEEYYLYQILLGSFPFKISDLSDYTQRLTLHMTKVVREGKKNSSWLSPNLQYEEQIKSFVSELLEPAKGNSFLEEFIPFQKKIAFFGFHNSLSQTLLKITSPGIPDFYQGSELWDLNLVDPDNRRLVNFKKRERYLEDIQDVKINELQELLKNFEDGRIKIFEINKALTIRNKEKKLFQNGICIPLQVKGAYSNNIIAFCRKEGCTYSITISPRFFANVTSIQNPAIGEIWKDTFVYLPIGTSKKWTEIFTGRLITAQKLGNDDGFYIEELLQYFPVALLLSGESNT